MSDERKAQVEETLNLKAVEKQLMTNYETLDKFIEKSEKELAESRSISTETKNAVEKLAEKSVELGDKLTELEQNQAARFDDEPSQKSLGEQFVESDVYQKAIETGSGTHKMAYKTTIVNAYSSGMSQPLV